MLALVCLLVSILGLSAGAGSTYYLGTGRYDITGPSVQIEMMGYAMPTQIGNGIHLRQFSRAFIIADEKNETRVVFVNTDMCMGTQIVKMRVIKKLQTLYGDTTYTHDNVLISGIHTHSGPAGYFQYVLYEVMSLGFVGQSLDVIVDGIVESIVLAHQDLKKGALSYGVGTLTGANINRSPSAYLNNTAEERSKYTENVDTAMVMLKFADAAGTGMGLLNWFSVHCTSMNSSNKLISSDNKGLASLMMESYKNGPSALPGRGDFVAAFAQSNEGDVSPNTKGARCVDTGKPCDFNSSTCHGRNELCIAPGPGKDMFDSTRIIATKQFEAGKDLYNGATTPVSGVVKYVYRNVDFSNITVMRNGKKVHTCKPAMGRSFAAGTTDGPGAFDFEQGDTKSNNPFWNAIRDILTTPSKEQVECQAPKPILLDTGEMNFPYPWEPKILPLQLLQIGQFVIIGVPGEFTTMAGRRLRDAVRDVLMKNNYPNDTRVVIAGLSNTYTGYITTYEEYQVQRYEGASTAYGQHTLEAYIQEFSILAQSLAMGSKVDAGPEFPNYYDHQWSFHLPIVYDGAPNKFGDVKEDADTTRTYKVNDTVEVVFWSGNPRNNLMTNGTYLTVELQDSSGEWQVAYTDASWETKFRWEQTNTLEGHSTVTVTWDIPVDVTLGMYRIQHFGYHKPIGSASEAYSGTSSVFKVGK